MKDEDARFAAESDALLRGARRRSLTILAMSAGYAAAAAVVTSTTEMPRTVILAAAASAVMIAWVNRRVIVEIPKFRAILSDPRLRGTRGVVASMIAVDAMSLVASVAGAAWLVSRLLVP